MHQREKLPRKSLSLRHFTSRKKNKLKATHNWVSKDAKISREATRKLPATRQTRSLGEVNFHFCAFGQTVFINNSSSIVSRISLKFSFPCEKNIPAKVSCTLISFSRFNLRLVNGHVETRRKFSCFFGGLSLNNNFKEIVKKLWKFLNISKKYFSTKLLSLAFLKNQ